MQLNSLHIKSVHTKVLIKVIKIHASNKALKKAIDKYCFIKRLIKNILLVSHFRCCPLLRGTNILFGKTFVALRRK